MTNTMRPNRAHFTVLLFALLQVFFNPVDTQAQKLKERMADRAAEQFNYPQMASIYEDLVAKGS